MPFFLRALGGPLLPAQSLKKQGVPVKKKLMRQRLGIVLSVVLAAVLLTVSAVAAALTPLFTVTGVEVTRVSATPTLTFALPGPTIAVDDSLGNPATSSIAEDTGLISYASSNTAIASVDAAGTVKAHAIGKVTITAVQAAVLPAYLEARASYELTVVAALVARRAVENKTLTVGQDAVSFAPIVAAGGSGALTYKISPALPAGLFFDAASGSITGNPTVASVATIYTVTVTDSAKPVTHTASQSFSLAVNNALAATQVVPSTVLTVGQSGVNVAPVSGSGGTGAHTYKVSPTLPTGLAFDVTTGTITGTPSTASRLPPTRSR